MDWRVVSIPLILLLWIDGGSAQLNCKDTNGTAMDWNCHSVSLLKGGVSDTDKKDCAAAKDHRVYCLTAANLDANNIWKPEANDRMKYDDSIPNKPRVENDCMTEWKDGNKEVRATCNKENCNVDMDNLLKQCNVGYVKCNNEYIHLNKTMTEIMHDTRDVGPMCLVTFTKSNGTWVPQNVTAHLGRSSLDGKDMSCDFNDVNDQIVHLKCQRNGTGDNCDQQAVSIYEKMSLEEFETKCNLRPFQPITETPQDSGMTFYYVAAGVVAAFIIIGVVFFVCCCWKMPKKAEDGKKQPQSVVPEKEMTPEEQLAEQAALKAKRAEAKRRAEYENDKKVANAAPRYGGELPPEVFEKMTPEEQSQAIKDGRIYLIAGENASLAGISSDYGPTAIVTKKEEK